MSYTNVYTFASIEEYARTANETVPVWGFESNGKHDSQWMPQSFSETVNHAIHGWPEGIAHMHRCAESIRQANVFKPVPKWSLDVAGSYPIVPIAIAGDPLCMMSKVPTLDRTHPVLRFNLNLSMNCNWSAQQAYNYGGALLAWINYLETLGFSIELNGYSYGTERCNGGRREPPASPGATLLITTGIKPAGQAPDLNRLAFALIHPGLIRRLKFRLLEKHPEYQHTMRDHYGYSYPLPETQHSDDELYLEGKNHDLQGKCNTPVAAVQLLREQIEAACKEANLPLDLSEAVEAIGE